MIKQTSARNLLDRLIDREDAILAFTKDPNIPFTNNAAERDLRMAKVKMKISGCFRSYEMAKLFLRTRSYLSTLRKQNLPLLENLLLLQICSPVKPTV